MNILPKKRWHVRTKENIARVRRDEAQAAEEERKLKMRIQLAEQETKLLILRGKAKERYDDTADRPKEVIKAESEHVNFFQDLEDGNIAHTGVNKEHEQEKKEEKEAYEKKIGYLTYLGQDTDEATGNVQWYNKLPARLDSTKNNKEVETKIKVFNDPLLVIKKYVDDEKKDINKIKVKIKQNDESSSKKHKKRKKKKEKVKHSSTIEELRAKRLKREREERFRASQILAKINGVTPVEKIKQKPPAIIQKYNSQFNPYLAKQNYPSSSSTSNT
ncbi:leukocyte receptor cluster member 1 homolog [Daktulosphaira vitifoliae]|uniref:leukocyte receptor cluster member 1 homolog n=1 Tax=Daktulosphaira vitifoliae TaxID=58002 RepID=UPI0021A9D395|nr:leukocyte receptor cluster member 1 homolog [Daktulosphaira vitifoliae]